jgi:pyrroloquinoline quinone (PQQ) biosynthesis protein C
VERDTGAVLVRKGARAFRLRFSAEAEPKFWKVKKHLIGGLSVDEIALRSEISPSDVAEIVAALERAGLLSTERGADSVRPTEAIRTFSESVDMWRDHMFQHELFGRLQSRSAPRQVLVGLALETYHSVSMTPKILATAVAHARDKNHQRRLNRLYLEEYEHAALISRSLSVLGLSASDIEAAQPLSSTISLANWKQQLARESTLSFLVCYAFSEAKPSEGWHAQEQLRDLARDYGFVETALDPFFDHMTEDLRSDHADLLTECLTAAGTLPTVEADFLTNSVHSLKHCFDDYHLGILTYYGDTKNTFPPNRLSFKDIALP